MLKTLHKNLIDSEWIELMEEAQSLGLTVEDVQLFLLENSEDKRN